MKRNIEILKWPLLTYKDKFDTQESVKVCSIKGMDVWSCN